jgi:hypothetical protein
VNPSKNRTFGGLFHDSVLLFILIGEAAKNVAPGSVAYSAAGGAATMAAAMASLWSLFQGGPTAFLTWRK